MPPEHDDHVIPGIILGLLLLIVFVFGFWFGSLSDDATLAAWSPPAPIPTPAARSVPPCERDLAGGELRFDGGCEPFVIPAPTSQELGIP